MFQSSFKILSLALLLASMVSISVEAAKGKSTPVASSKASRDVPLIINDAQRTLLNFTKPHTMVGGCDPNFGC